MNGVARGLRRGGATGVLLATLLMGGCLGDPEIAEFVDSVAWEVHPARLEPVHEIRIGSGVLGLASLALSFADVSELEEQQARALLHDLSAVHVGQYDIRGRRGPIHMSEDWRLDLQERGWIPLVRAREHGESTQWVMALLEDEELVALTIVSIDPHELTVVKLEGRLQRSLDYAMRRDEGFLHTARDAGQEL